MSKYAQSLAAFSIMGAAILGAVAVLLVGALGFGTVAKWSRNQDKE